MALALKAELDAFRRFCTVRFYGAQSLPILPVTAEKYCDHIRCANDLRAGNVCSSYNDEQL